MVDQVTPTESNPDYHLTLTSGATTMGFLLCDSQGKPLYPGERNWPIRIFPLEQRGLQTFEGQGDYDASRWPYMTIQQADFSGGIGGEVFDEDKSKVMDCYRMNTTKQGKVFMGPAETFTRGHRNMDYNLSNTPSGLYFVDLLGAGLYATDSFVASASYNADRIYFIIKKVGTPGTLTMALYADNVGEPAGSATKTATVTAASITDTVSVLKLGDWTTTTALTAGTTYWGVIYGAATDNDTNHWEVACQSGTNLGKKSSVGEVGTWAGANYAPWFMVQAAPLSWDKGKFIKYKGGLYFMSQPSSGNSALYINGDRGAADDNTGAQSTLIDATKAWTADEWIGSYAVLTAGPGCEEAQPWRQITDNDATSLTVSPSWNVIHTTSTEYVIVGSDKWQQVDISTADGGTQDMGAYCTDACVAGNYIYFAKGQAANILRYEAYNAAGTWTDRNVAEGNSDYRAHSLASIKSPEDGKRWVYGLRRSTDPYYRHIVLGVVSPPTWEDLHYPVGQLVSTEIAWGEQSIANVTQSINNGRTRIAVAAGFTTGAIASMAITATNILNARSLGVMIHSNVAVASGQLQFSVSSVASLGGTPANFNLPAIVANTWTWVEADVTATLANPDCRAIISVGLRLTADLGAQNITLDGGVQLLSDRIIAASLPTDELPLGIIPYSGSTTDPRENPWIRTSKHWYEMQTQNDDALVPMPIGEMQELADDTANFVACTNDVYLYFALADRVERYTQRNMEDISPQNDYFPTDRWGMPTAMVSYPGHVYIAFDGGSSNFSSILAWRGNAMHEVYRAPEKGQRIQAMINEKLPGNGTGRLWFLKDSDLMYVQTSLDPLNDSNYDFTYEGFFTTGWIYVNMRALVKLWRYLSVFSENVDGTSFFVYADYMTDDDTSWTAIADDFISPDETNELTTTPVSAKRLRLRFRVYSSTAKVLAGVQFGIPTTAISVINAWTLSAFGIDDTKYGYQITALLADKTAEIDDLAENEGRPLGTDDTVSAALSRLQAYISAGTPMTTGSMFAPIYNKTVKIQPYSLTPLYIDAEDQVSKYILQLILYEI